MVTVPLLVAGAGGPLSLSMYWNESVAAASPAFGVKTNVPLVSKTTRPPFAVAQSNGAVRSAQPTTPPMDTELPSTGSLSLSSTLLDTETFGSVPGVAPTN